jgi:hypothetical protein
MNLPCLRSSQVLIAAALMAALTCAAAASPAYLEHLSESDILNAYNIGQHHDSNLTRFLSDYEKPFPNVAGIHLTRIAVRTPFCSLVVRSFQGGSFFREKDLRDDYFANPEPFIALLTLDTHVLRPPSPEDVANARSSFWRGYDLQLSQDQPIRVRNISANPIVNLGGPGNTRVVTGGELYFEYDLRDVASSMTHVQVTSPDGKTYVADFDLEKLR